LSTQQNKRILALQAGNSARQEGKHGSDTDKRIQQADRRGGK